MPKYRFDEIAINSTEKKKPVEADKDTYIGLEHLDSGCLEVTRWGAEVAPVGDKLVMQKGDVLFGRRRAYQKKVAIAPFDGIFSAHGMVLRPIESVVSKEFFPFFISSDYFLDAAIKISVGSLSPTINWRDLAKLEFQLPTLDEQKALAGVLWAMNRLKVAYIDLLQQADALVQSQFVEMFGDPFESPMWETRSLCDVISSIDDGSNVDTSAYASEGRIVFLRIQNVWRDEIRLDDVVYISESTNQRYATTTLLTGDLLITKIGRINTADSSLGRVSVYRGESGKANYSNNIMRIRFTNEVKSEFINSLMNLPKYQLFIRQSCQGSTDKRALSKAVIGKYPIVVPPIGLQEQYIDFYRQTDKSKLAIRQALDSLEKSRTAIMNKVFG